MFSALFVNLNGECANILRFSFYVNRTYFPAELMETSWPVIL